MSAASAASPGDGARRARPGRGIDRRGAWAVLAVLLALGATGGRIVAMERLRADRARWVYLDVAAVPAAGAAEGVVAVRYGLEDYLDRFIEDEVPVWRAWPPHGRLALKLGDGRVAVAARWHGRHRPLQPRELVWRYRIARGRLVVGPGAWPAAPLAPPEAARAARYAVLAVDASGRHVPVGLADAARVLLTRPWAPPRDAAPAPQGADRR